MIEVILTYIAIVLPQVPGVYVGPACEGHPARPSASYTTALKVLQLEDLGYADQNPTHYQEDHLVSLSLGGAPKDPRNLWPQPLAQAKVDDKFEYDLYRRVCLHIGAPITVKSAVRKEKAWKHLNG